MILLSGSVWTLGRLRDHVGACGGHGEGEVVILMCNNARTECSGDPAAGAGAADEAVCRNVVWRQSGECQCGV